LGPFPLESGIVPFTTAWSKAAILNWKKLAAELSDLSIERLFTGQLELLISKSERGAIAERTLIDVQKVCEFLPSMTSRDQQVWASDGSMIPATVGIGDPKSVTAAVTGPSTLVVKLPDNNISILHGELMGLVMSLVFADSSLRSPILYSDHLNSVRLIKDSRSLIDQSVRLRRMNGRSYYRWILSLLNEKGIDVEYTAGHSDEVSIPARMNFEADRYASNLQKFINAIPYAPTPTFFMDDHAFYCRWMD
jgi:hypothetical protein